MTNPQDSPEHSLALRASTARLQYKCQGLQTELRILMRPARGLG
jgi:hypothetical protein